ncbi:c-type cytochrome [Hyalangium rubrum]|uniref:C-type cytochrome n=1 Tax=Hyalangium rubrum TaxID=3103134 RepID=A0ABU5HCT1_9BACT|nr:c-type cytochrome [Hyalangium sp. s54d21]MDY7231275.1 c-type cytochrome [Hyalangium sp. s54d21]
MPSLPRRIAVAVGALAALVLGSCGGDSEPTPEPVSDCPTGGTTLTAQNFGLAFFQSYCTRCHSSTRTGAARNGAPPDFNYDTIEGIRAHLRDIDAEAGADGSAVNTEMPPGDPRPTDAERRQLSEWIGCGAN